MNDYTLRGGSFFNHCGYARCAFRHRSNLNSNYHSGNLGFRVAIAALDDDSEDGSEVDDYVSRVLRGGSFCYNRDFARCAYRSWFNPNSRARDFGFRVEGAHTELDEPAPKFGVGTKFISQYGGQMWVVKKVITATRGGEPFYFYEIKADAMIERRATVKEAALVEEYCLVVAEYE